MKRKIILMGGKTHVVSLPATFVKTNNIRKGDEINLEVDGNNLKLTAENVSKTNEVTIEITDENMIEPSLNLFYALGVDQIKILCNPELLDQIKESIEDFFGLEIITESPKGCIIKSLAIIMPDIDNFVNQCFFKVASAETPQKVLAAKKTINYCLRVLSKMQTKKAYSYLRILSYLKQSFNLDKELIENLRILAFKFDCSTALKLRCSNIPSSAKELLDVIIGMNIAS